LIRAGSQRLGLAPGGGQERAVAGFADGPFRAGKRVGKMYNDNGATNQAVAIDPFNITNLFVNYTLKGASRFAQTKIKLAVNNLFNDQNIVGVNPASTKTSVPAPGDVLNIMAARSVSLTFTIGVSAARP
jgi:hypothetical protein